MESTENKETKNQGMPEEDEDMLEKIVETECGCRTCKCGNSHCEFASDFLGGDDHDAMTDSGEPVYHHTAQYRMIDPSNESADCGKS